MTESKDWGLSWVGGWNTPEPDSPGESGSGGSGGPLINDKVELSNKVKELENENKLLKEQLKEELTGGWKGNDKVGSGGSGWGGESGSLGEGWGEESSSGGSDWGGESSSGEESEPSDPPPSRRIGGYGLTGIMQKNNRDVKIIPYSSLEGIMQKNVKKNPTLTFSLVDNDNNREYNNFANNNHKRYSHVPISKAKAILKKHANIKKKKMQPCFFEKHYKDLSLQEQFDHSKYIIRAADTIKNLDPENFAVRLDAHMVQKYNCSYDEFKTNHVKSEKLHSECFPVTKNWYIPEIHAENKFKKMPNSKLYDIASKTIKCSALRAQHQLENFFHREYRYKDTSYKNHIFPIRKEYNAAINGLKNLPEVANTLPQYYEQLSTLVKNNGGKDPSRLT